MPSRIDTAAAGGTLVLIQRSERRNISLKVCYRLKVMCRSRTSNHVRHLNVKSQCQLTMAARDNNIVTICNLCSVVADKISKASLDRNVAAFSRLVNVKRHPLNVHGDA